jgi:hypothetical protein
LTGVGDYFGLAWAPGLGLVFNNGTTVGHHGARSRLFSGDPNGTSTTELDQLVETTPECWRQEQLRPTSLLDGRLGYAQVCNSQTVGFETWSLHAYDPGTGEAVELVRSEEMLRTFTLDRATGAVYFSNGAGICDGIAEATGGIASSLEGTVEHAGSSLDLKAAYTSSGLGDCPDVGRADSPALSPDGTSLAFMVSFSTASGMGRLDEPWDIFLRDLATGEDRYLWGGITDPTDFAWSPSGRWLAVAGKINRDTGLYVIDALSGEATLFSSDDIFRFAWSPDGKQIVASVQPVGTDTSRLVLFDAGAIDAR